MASCGLEWDIFKNTQVMLAFLMAQFYVISSFFYAFNDLPDGGTCKIAIFASIISPYSECD